MALQFLRKKAWLFHVLGVVVVLNLVCKAPPKRRSAGRQPIVRVGLLQGETEIRFEAFEKSALDGNKTSSLRSLPAGRWRVEVVDPKPTQVEYRLSVGVRKDRRSAEQVVAFMRKKGLDASIKKHRLRGNDSISQIHKAVYQVLLSKKFQNEEQARQYKSSIQKKTSAKITRLPLGAAGGTLRFTNLVSGRPLELKQPVRLNTRRIKVWAGQEFDPPNSKGLDYEGVLEFLIDTDGRITVVNELLLEDYVRGVVPSEMSAGFPYEALKAQAVAARVEAVSKRGLHEPGGGFDLCATVHCQVYSGLSRQTEETSMAVENTHGVFALYQNEIIEASYSAMCGGHTENNENVWNADAKPYLRGVLDRAGKNLGTSLASEQNVKRWIDSSPDVNSNIIKRKGPKSLDYSKKYFRWQREFERQELEEIIRAKTGENFGSLKDLKPVRRGVSGRLIELEVVGTEKSFTILREFAIRQALSGETLFSACFYVIKLGPARGLAKKFLFKGAGWGHGVGMCQVGAAMMAHNGRRFDQILTHYYRGIELKKLYN